MQSDADQGNVLVFTDDAPHAEKLRRWIQSAGLKPVLLTGAEKFFIHTGDDDTIDLVLTDLDTDVPQTRRLFDRLLSGELFPDIPQLHLLRDLELSKLLREKSSFLEATSMSRPVEAGEFQGRLLLAAEVGRLRRELQRSNIYDALTGMLDRRYLMLRLEQEFARARRYRSPLSMVVFDVDHLRRINEHFGQESGDRVLRHVSRALRRQVRREDICGRIGSKSFGVVLSGSRYRGAAIFANKVRSDVEGLSLSHDGQPMPATLSAGVCSYPASPAVQTSEALLARAEDAAREAKARGRNRVYIDETTLSRDRPLVLVADPDRELLETAQELLAEDDLRVVVTDESETVVETLRFRKPDLLIVDLQLESDRSGLPLIERIQELCPAADFPIIGLSGDPGSDPDRLGRLGVDRFITKPFSVSLLRSVARELIDAKNAG